MGDAAGTAAHAASLFQTLGQMMATIPADYNTNYQKKNGDAQKLSQMATDKAKTVFFEPVTSFDQIKMPDAKNYVKLDDRCKAPLDEVPPMSDVFRHIIPP